MCMSVVLSALVFVVFSCFGLCCVLCSLICVVFSFVLLCSLCDVVCLCCAVLCCLCSVLLRVSLHCLYRPRVICVFF